MSKPPKTRLETDEEFIGFDLGHGETALGRAYGATVREPEILEYRGQRSFVTAVAKDGKDIKIGADALSLSFASHKPDVWLKFKSRHLDAKTAEPITYFTQALIEGLSEEKTIRGPKKSRFVIGCPSGWDNITRDAYRKVFEQAGLDTVRIVPESRAALMTSLEQGYVSIEDTRASVLIIDIGSSTTDFTYCRDLDADDVGHNELGSGLLDDEIFKLNLSRQKSKKEIGKLIDAFPHYKSILTYWCRQAKEAYFTGEDIPVEMIKRLPAGKRVFFDIRMDKKDAKHILETSLEALNGYSWKDAFDYALKETIESLGGRAPDTVLLTGGASRLPLVLPATQKAFPNARVIRGAEPEFAIARGLAWLGRFEYLHANFKMETAALLAEDGEVHLRAQEKAQSLGGLIAPVLVDAMTEDCILPAFREWRSGAIASLDDVEGVLEEKVKTWLESEKARESLRPVIDNWFATLQRDVEAHTDPLCRAHGLPAMVLSLDGSEHVSRHLEGLSVSAPGMASLESDTALVGTGVSALLVSALLAKANLFAALFVNPIGIVVGGALLGGSYLFGRKAISGKMRKSKLPVFARQILSDARVKAAAKRQRPDLIKAVSKAWDEAAAERFSAELTNMLKRALVERADERAVLFLI
ncbi:Hsp70 family protein [Litorimonas haliclonae]|uniref:Hsp70 family protein n=1 Tax=Litorimonas haliclonae TaxID=2081977 RepID=UPI0039F05D6D